MGLSYAESVELGIGHLHPDAPPPREDPVPPSDSPRPPSSLIPHPSSRSDEADRRNRTERRFADEVLEPLRRTASIVRYEYEPLRFRLAGRCFYTPDYLAFPYGSRATLFDVKGGFIREDAAIKIKVAANLYPEFRWFLACYGGRAWRLHRVTDRGIAANPSPIADIYGRR